MSATAVTVYGNPNCRQCKLTTKLLDEKGVAYEYVDLHENLDAGDAVREFGYSQAPVVFARLEGETEDRHWSGFQPDRLKELA